MIEANKPVELNVFSSGCSQDKEKHIKYLEHVELFVNIEYPRRGDLEIRIISPSGNFFKFFYNFFLKLFF